MTFTANEELRVEQIEEAIVTLLNALNNTATKHQLKSLLNVRQSEIKDLQDRVTALETQVALLQAG